MDPSYVTQMNENSLIRSTSFLVKFLVMLLVSEAARGFHFESVIQRTTAGPNVYLGPAAVKGKFGLVLGIV